jgi:hypothetical protein
MTGRGWWRDWRRAPHRLRGTIAPCAPQAPLLASGALGVRVSGGWVAVWSIVFMFCAGWMFRGEGPAAGRWTARRFGKLPSSPHADSGMKSSGFLKLLSPGAAGALPLRRRKAPLRLVGHLRLCGESKRPDIRPDSVVSAFQGSEWGKASQPGSQRGTSAGPGTRFEMRSKAQRAGTKMIAPASVNPTHTSHRFRSRGPGTAPGFRPEK